MLKLGEIFLVSIQGAVVKKERRKLALWVAIGEAWTDHSLLSLPWVYVNNRLKQIMYDEGRLVKLYILLCACFLFAGVAQW